MKKLLLIATAQPVLLGFGLGLATLAWVRGKNPATARV